MIIELYFRGIPVYIVTCIIIIGIFYDYNIEELLDDIFAIFMSSFFWIIIVPVLVSFGLGRLISKLFIEKENNNENN